MLPGKGRATLPTHHESGHFEAERCRLALEPLLAIFPLAHQLAHQPAEWNLQVACAFPAATARRPCRGELRCRAFGDHREEKVRLFVREAEQTVSEAGRHEIKSACFNEYSFSSCLPFGAALRLIVNLPSRIAVLANALIAGHPLLPDLNQRGSIFAAAPAKPADDVVWVIKFRLRTIRIC